MGVCMSIDEGTLQIQCGPDVRARHKKKKRLIMELLSAESKAYRILCKMPDRISTNGATEASSVYTKQGRKGVNQDCVLAWEGFAAQANTVLCGVYDGHGLTGHLVSRKVRDTLPLLLALPLNSLWDGDVHPVSDGCDGEDEGSEGRSMTSTTESHFFSIWKQKFVAAYKMMDRNLKMHPKLHCFDSGTTAVTVVLQDKDLVVGNVGDSRAILARRTENGSLVADQLTIDLKPNLPGELERIKSCRGRVFALEDEPQVPRLWQPHSDMPGLAMARALGDFCLKKYGLSAIPDVFYRKLTEYDEFVVLASDGVWDVLSNDDVVGIVASASPKETAAKCVVDAAIQRWKLKYGSWRTDDCSVVCHFVNERLTPAAPPNTWSVEKSLATMDEDGFVCERDDHIEMELLDK